MVFWQVTIDAKGPALLAVLGAGAELPAGALDRAGQNRP